MASRLDIPILSMLVTFLEMSKVKYRLLNQSLSYYYSCLNIESEAIVVTEYFRIFWS